MLRSLEIRNYRNLRHLTIEKLGRVNLLVGKNNTGKTSVLEAVYLWANYGRFETVYEIIETRDGLFESVSEDRFVRSQAVLESLYTDRLSYNSGEKISIAFQKESGISTLTLNLLPNKVKVEGSINDSFLLAFVAEHSDYNVANHIRADQFLRLKEPDFPSYNFPKDIKNQFIRSNEISNIGIGFLYDEIVTTDWEDEVINALKIIDSRISKLAFLTDTLSRKRYPVVRLEGSSNRLPLRSMGDGVNRILSIILSMVNCENGYLLIDEFENGLHYSVQAKLWEVIFYLAERLNIQVFATTHSLDCVEAFSTIVNSGKQDKEAGMMIRLENYEGNIEAAVYDADEIQATTRVHVDPR